MKNYYKEHCKKEPWYRHFHSIRSRVNDKTDKYYKNGIKNFLTLQEVKLLWFRDGAFKMSKPSVDRINNLGDYTLTNCRFLELSENSRLGNIGNHNKLGKYKKGVTKIRTLRMRAWRENKRR